MSNEAEADQWRVKAIEAESERERLMGMLEARGDQLAEVKAARRRDLAVWEARSAGGREQVARLIATQASLREDLAQARLERDGALETIDRLSPEAVNRMKDELATANTRVAALERDYFRVRGERDVARDELRQEAEDGLAVAARLEEARENEEAWRQTSLAASLRSDAMRAERDELLGQRAVQVDQAVIARLAAEERERIDGLAQIVAEQSDAIAKLGEGLEHALEAEECARDECDELRARVDRALERTRLRAVDEPSDSLANQILALLEPDPPLRPENFEAMQEVQGENFEALREAFEERLDALEKAAARHYGAPAPGMWGYPDDAGGVGLDARKITTSEGVWKHAPGRVGRPDGSVMDSEPVTSESLQKDEGEFSRQHEDGALGEYVEHRLAQRVVRDFASTARRWDRYLTRHE